MRALIGSAVVAVLLGACAARGPGGYILGAYAPACAQRLGRCPSGLCVSAMVRDADGTPVQGAAVGAWTPAGGARNADGALVAEALTDARGHVRLELGAHATGAVVLIARPRVLELQDERSETVTTLPVCVDFVVGRRIDPETVAGRRP